MADEYIDIIDQQGNPTGAVRLKSEAHQLGLCHASIHVWFYTLEGEVLLQKRAAHKDTFPNLWDISVAGHIGAGETPTHAAVREVHEEIGIDIASEDLIHIKNQWATKRPQPNILDCELHYIYIAEFKTELEHLSLQEEEVADIKCIPLSTFIEELNSPTTSNGYVPHGAAYYKMIFEAIKNQIS